MNKNSIHKIIDQLRNNKTSNKLIQDRILNYIEANIDEFIEVYNL